MNPTLKQWIDEVSTLCQPKEIVFWHGRQEEYDKTLKDLVAQGKAIPLNPEKKPGCFLFRTDESDVARVEERTFISTTNPEDAGPTNNWVSPVELKKTMTNLYLGSMKGRTMYVIPFSMGPIGSKYAKIGVELTDSPYVAVHMHIMTRTGDKVLDVLKDSPDFVKCLHSIGYPLEAGQKDVLWPCAPIEQKYISHFPEENMIWSYGSGYGGNALLGKKCFALRIASKIAKNEGWLAEHMLILKLTSPQNKVTYVTGAFPSACGKTNLAMIRPSLPGWGAKVLGDDIAWMHFDDSGNLRAINPENGFFGVAPGTSPISNPNAVETVSKDTLFTNVALTDDGDVWWEDLTEEAPNHLIDWKGRDWYRGSTEKPAHPNSRFTSPLSNNPMIDENYQNPDGVVISAMLFGGRRPTRIPLIHQAFSHQHGVFMGSIMGSEITKAVISKDYGKVRRDPFAMLPFIGYHIADYVNHWLELGKNPTYHFPPIFYINWFRKNSEGKYLWPGFSENIRVLKWIIGRIEGTAKAIETPIGYLPRLDDFDTDGLHVSKADLITLFDVDTNDWISESQDIEQYYQIYNGRLPKALRQELDALKSRLYEKKNAK